MVCVCVFSDFPILRGGNGKHSDYGYLYYVVFRPTRKTDTTRFQALTRSTPLTAPRIGGPPPIGGGRRDSTTRGVQLDDPAVRFLAAPPTPEPPAAPPAKPRKASLSRLVEQYNADASHRAASGRIAPTRAQAIAVNLKRLLDIAGDQSIASMSTITTLQGIRDMLRAAAEQGRWKASTVAGTWRDTVAMLRWAYDLELLKELPRGLRRLGAIHIPRPEPRTFADGELLALWNEARPLMRCWIMLGLNCGFTSIDIATLRPSHIVDHGTRIRRERHKTRVPTDHLLWPLTAHLLSQSNLTDTGWISQRGRQLVNDGATGAWHCDAIGRRWCRLCAKVGLPGKPYRLLRKTTAQLLSDRGCPLPIIQQYLGHARATVAERHYYTPSSRTLLDPWLTLIEPVYRLTPPPPAPMPPPDADADARTMMGDLWPGEPVDP